MFSLKNDTWNLLALIREKKTNIFLFNPQLSRVLFLDKQIPQQMFTNSIDMLLQCVIHNKHYKFIPVTLPMIKFHA